MDNVTDSIHNEKCVSGPLLDITKALIGTVHHGKLTSKLHSCGFRRIAILNGLNLILVIDNNLFK